MFIGIKYDRRLRSICGNESADPKWLFSRHYCPHIYGKNPCCVECSPPHAVILDFNRCPCTRTGIKIFVHTAIALHPLETFGHNHQNGRMLQLVPSVPNGDFNRAIRKEDYLLLPKDKILDFCSNGSVLTGVKYFNSDIYVSNGSNQNALVAIMIDKIHEVIDHPALLLVIICFYKVRMRICAHVLFLCLAAYHFGRSQS